MGEGKGWAKGRNAKNDPRIARAAAAHRGMQYVPRVPPKQDRRRKTAPAVIEWRPNFAYAMGLLATDGAIVRGRTISFPSADRELVEHLLRCLGKANTISQVRTKSGGTAYRTQIGDVALCRWLPTIGITARKSLVLGAVDVPDALLADLLRGLLDGDGSIINKRARADTGRTRDYQWEYLRTTFLSAVGHTSSGCEGASTLCSACRDTSRPRVRATDTPRCTRSASGSEEVSSCCPASMPIPMPRGSRGSGKCGRTTCDDTRLTLALVACRSSPGGETGRRACLRGMCPKGLAGSSPALGTDADHRTRLAHLPLLNRSERITARTQ